MNANWTERVTRRMCELRAWIEQRLRYGGGVGMQAVAVPVYVDDSFVPGQGSRLRVRPSATAWFAVGALALGLPALTACGGVEVAAEPDEQWARAELVSTFTPLPPATATITPLPSATATAPYSTPTPDPFEAAGAIVRLEIPAIGVDAAVEKVGRIPSGGMDVPKIPENVAWFVESALPGQPVDRPSVIAGHLDSPYGPAVFYELRKLMPGDELAITYQNGDRHVFVVTNKERYVHDQAPVDKIFGKNNDRMLNLITCDGAWDRGAANYQQRLVIYTKLVTDKVSG